MALTVEKLIKKLEKLPKDKEVVVAIPRGREGEYYPISGTSIDNLLNQNTDGDPYYYQDREVVVIS